jgi:beta-aspartyl-peptidase (threonine type)
MSWSLVIHGGAGTIRKDTDPEVRAAHVKALEEALELGRELLTDGGAALDVVVEVVARLEEAPCFNAGKGSVFTAEGGHEMDAAVMTDSGEAGAVCAVKTVRNPVRLARQVMERTEHALLAGHGAEAFADTTGVERVDNAWFDTAPRRAQWEKVKARAGREVVDAEWQSDEKHGTVGAVALDDRGRLAAATSTGGLTNKRWGRVGDSAVPGAGVWADERCALSGTGLGEIFLQRALCVRVAHRVELAGETLEAAAGKVFYDEVAAGAGGVIGIDSSGNIVMTFNSVGMYRGAATSAGRFEVAIW